MPPSGWLSEAASVLTAQVPGFLCSRGLSFITFRAMSFVFIFKMKIFQLVGFFFPKEIALYFYEDY